MVGGGGGGEGDYVEMTRSRGQVRARTLSCLWRNRRLPDEEKINGGME